MIEIIPEIEIISRVSSLKSMSEEERKYFWIGDHFQWYEFFSGDKVYGAKSIEPPESMWADAVEHILYMDRVREYCGWGVRYNSGYRTPIWNKVWKGAEDSRHMYCLAGDMFPLGRITIHKFAMIIALLTPLNQGGIYNGWSKWVHIGSVSNSTLYKW